MVFIISDDVFRIPGVFPQVVLRLPFLLPAHLLICPLGSLLFPHSDGIIHNTAENVIGWCVTGFFGGIKRG